MGTLSAETDSCPHCAGTGKAWSHAAQMRLSSRPCFFCRGTPADYGRIQRETAEMRRAIAARMAAGAASGLRGAGL